MMTQVQNPFTVHNLFAATAIADANNAGDEDGWIYTVIPYGVVSYRVEVRDEAGFVVGYL